MSAERFSGYTFQIGFLHKTVRKGFKVSEVPFHFIDRTVGESKMGMEYIKNTLVYIFKVRIKEIVESRVFKFLAIGGSSALLQLVTLELWRKILPYEAAYFAAVECSVLYNFVFNNFWTFSDRKLSLGQYPAKFVQFNLASAGSIIIQLIIAAVGKNVFGLHPLFTLPGIHKVIDTGTAYAVIGIFVGLFWNFFAYSKIVWKSAESKK
jgi:dolichol-phosphate mannosyltransferase